MHKLVPVLVHLACLVEGQPLSTAHRHNRKSALARFLFGLNTPSIARRPSWNTAHARAQATSMSSGISRQGLLRSTAAALIGASSMFSSSANAGGIPPEAIGDENIIMSEKAHGTTATAVQENLRFSVDRKVADRICSYNRRYAEYATYWEKTPFGKEFMNMVAAENGPVTFYDSVSGKPLFRAPVGRSAEDFLTESRIHGWPSFRDAEVVWENVRILKDGETVSVDGTHLGHDLPDQSGNRYCINLVSVSGQPAQTV